MRGFLDDPKHILLLPEHRFIFMDFRDHIIRTFSMSLEYWWKIESFSSGEYAIAIGFQVTLMNASYADSVNLTDLPLFVINKIQLEIPTIKIILFKRFLINIFTIDPRLFSTGIWNSKKHLIKTNLHSEVFFFNGSLWALLNNKMQTVITHSFWVLNNEKFLKRVKKEVYDIRKSKFIIEMERTDKSKSEKKSCMFLLRLVRNNEWREFFCWWNILSHNERATSTKVFDIFLFFPPLVKFLERCFYGIQMHLGGGPVFYHTKKAHCFLLHHGHGRIGESLQFISSQTA